MVALTVASIGFATARELPTIGFFAVGTVPGILVGYGRLRVLGSVICGLLTGAFVVGVMELLAFPGPVLNYVSDVVTRHRL